MMRLAGRRILITGAASGIGLATAVLFLREGAKVALLDIDSVGLQAAARQLDSDGSVVVRADVADESQVRTAIGQAVRELGALDGVVNAAGIDLQRPFGSMTSAEWTRVLAVNLNGPMFVCAASLPALKASGRGTIVMIASAAALRPLEERTAYCAAKAGLVMFSKTLAVDLASHRIRVNAVCPGVIDTPLFHRSFETASDPDAELRKILDRYLLKQPGKPNDIAYAALYLSSDESAYVTGTALAVDGGRTFH